jgi:FtsH-binding integral membrane protein
MVSHTFHAVGDWTLVVLFICLIVLFGAVFAARLFRRPLNPNVQSCLCLVVVGLAGLFLSARIFGALFS